MESVKKIMIMSLFKLLIIYEVEMVKLKVNLPCAQLRYHAINTYEEVEVQLHAFLTSVLDGGEWSASHPRRFTPVPIGYKAGWATVPM
jgi:hypothetical protein